MTEQQALADSAEMSLNTYAANLADIHLREETPVNVYRKVIDVAEKGLLEATMERSRGNQSRAAICLGINRATLRSKLKRHGLMVG